MGRSWWVLLGALAACGGTTAALPSVEPVAADAGVDAADAAPTTGTIPYRVVMHSEEDTLPFTGPDASLSATVPCNPNEQRVGGSCTIAAGGTILENGPTGASSWSCAAWTDRDGVVMTTRVTCASPEIDAGSDQ